MDMPVPEGTEIKVTQTGSVSGRTERVIRNLQSMGLGRIGRSKVHKATPSLWGKLAKVGHLVKIEKV